LCDSGVTAVELSALREAELEPLFHAVDSLDLDGFRYISMHAPSRYEQKHEARITALLKQVWRRRWPIVVHPDTMHDFRLPESCIPRGTIRLEMRAPYLIFRRPRLR
jgi:hypothetical protein